MRHTLKLPMRFTETRQRPSLIRGILREALGDFGLICVEYWPHGDEVDWPRRRVLFFSEDGQWMVGYSFDQIKTAGLLAGPQQFADMVRRAMRQTRGRGS
jgi:hypothetical protein